MAVRVNPDGSITVGVLRDEKETKPVEKEVPAPQAAKKPTKKKQ